MPTTKKTKKTKKATKKPSTKKRRGVALEQYRPGYRGPLTEEQKMAMMLKEFAKQGRSTNGGGTGAAVPQNQDMNRLAVSMQNLQGEVSGIKSIMTPLFEKANALFDTDQDLNPAPLNAHRRGGGGSVPSVVGDDVINGLNGFGLFPTGEDDVFMEQTPARATEGPFVPFPYPLHVPPPVYNTVDDDFVEEMPPVRPNPVRTRDLPPVALFSGDDVAYPPTGGLDEGFANGGEVLDTTELEVPGEFQAAPYGGDAGLPAAPEPVPVSAPAPEPLVIPPAPYPPFPGRLQIENNVDFIRDDAQGRKVYNRSGLPVFPEMPNFIRDDALGRNRVPKRNKEEALAPLLLTNGDGEAPPAIESDTPAPKRIKEPIADPPTPPLPLPVPAAFETSTPAVPHPLQAAVPASPNLQIVVDEPVAKPSSDPFSTPLPPRRDGGRNPLVPDSWYKDTGMSAEEKEIRHFDEANRLADLKKGKSKGPAEAAKNDKYKKTTTIQRPPEDVDAYHAAQKQRRKEKKAAKAAAKHQKAEDQSVTPSPNPMGDWRTGQS